MIVWEGRKTGIFCFESLYSEKSSQRKTLMKFGSTETYIATEELQMAVNAAVTLERPLLIKGEPGTGNTMLAEEIASSLGMKIITWYVKSPTKAQQGLYEYDAVSRLRDSQLGDDRVHDINNYIDCLLYTSPSPRD